MDPPSALTAPSGWKCASSTSAAGENPAPPVDSAFDPQPTVVVRRSAPRHSKSTLARAPMRGKVLPCCTLLNM